MSLKRRDFIQSLSGFAGLSLLTVNPLLAAEISPELAAFNHLDPEDAAKDEAYWDLIRAAYSSSTNLINLNNGGVSPQPVVVQEKVNQYYRFANENPGFYMWRTMGRLKPTIRRRLADLAGCSTKEIAILLNATQALESVILGLDLKEGDEIVTTDQDYPSILNTLEMLQRRHGIKVIKISLPVPCSDKAEILRRFEAAIGPKTKAILFCHMINITGQILPAADLCRMAREKGVYSIVDGAHSFCHLDFKVPDLDCDFFGTSLHKWLCAPFGTGMLYMRESLIPEVWPLNGYPIADHDKITKFEHVGTRSIPLEMGITDAIQFHNEIGTARKEARLRYLKDYWVNQVINVKGFHLNTPMEAEFSCGIASFRLDGITGFELSRRLLNEYQLYVTTFKDPVPGVRISPNVYTSLKDLDFLVIAIRELAEKFSQG